MKKSNLGEGWYQFADSVTVVGSAFKGKKNLMAATWCVSVSTNPPLLAVNIRPTRFTHELIKKSEEFTISILADDQAEVSNIAGGASGRSKDKLAEIETVEGNNVKAPIVKGCVAAFECKLTKSVTAGDHTIFVGEIVNMRADEGKKPLIMFRSEYYGLGNKR